MLSILDPKVAVFLQNVGVGLFPYTIEGEATPRLIIKASKEMMLAAKMNGGFKIYVFPLKITEQNTIGMLSAFFDDVDEPLVIFTQLFADPLTALILRDGSSFAVMFRKVEPLPNTVQYFLLDSL